MLNHYYVKRKNYDVLSVYGIFKNFKPLAGILLGPEYPSLFYDWELLILNINRTVHKCSNTLQNFYRQIVVLLYINGNIPQNISLLAKKKKIGKTIGLMEGQIIYGHNQNFISVNSL